MGPKFPDGSRPGTRKFAGNRLFLTADNMPLLCKVSVRASESAPSRLKVLIVTPVPGEDESMLPMGPEFRLEMS